MTRVSVFGLLVGLAAFGVGQGNPANEMIFTDKEAIGLLPPIVVSNGTTTETKWSPDGKLLLVSATEMKLTPAAMSDFIAKGMTGGPPVLPTQHLQLFNVDKQTSISVWRGSVLNGKVSDIAWLPGGRSAVVLVETPTKPAVGQPIDSTMVVYGLNAASGKLTVLLQGEENELVGLDVDESAKGAIIVCRKYPENPAPENIQTRFIRITPDGRLGNVIQVAGRAAFGQIAWINGTRPMMVRFIPPQPGEKAKHGWFDLDFASGQLRPAADPQYRVPAEVQGPFALKFGSSVSPTEGKSVNSKAAWIVAQEKGPQQSALVAADVDDASLSPSLNAVYYSTKGVGMVRLFMKIPKDVALKALEAAQRALVMNEAKQVGTALHIYAADMDDVLPANTGDWMTALSPYLKNNSLMDGFVYTFGGGNLSDIENPAKTSIGYKSGPGGRAVVYADGHVKWEPNP